MPTHKCLFLFLGLLVAAVLYGKADSLTVDFGVDTFHACMWVPTELEPIVSGGTAPYSYVWSTGDSTPSIQIVPNSIVLVIGLSIIDSLGNQASSTVVIHGFPECVWPGDANGDGQANGLDLLTLGQTYGESGIGRINPHFNWVGQPAPAWMQQLPSGVNLVHADTDGSGLIDSLDIEGIRHNYFAPLADSGLSPVTATGNAFYLDIDTGGYLPGDTVVIPIILGTVDSPADSVFGLSFSINFDNSQLDTSYFKVNIEDSWLGTPGQDLLTIHQLFFDDGQIDLALTRFDDQPISGYGRLGDITVVIDDLILKKEEIIHVQVNLSHTSLMDVAGNALEVAPYDGEISIILSGSSPQDVARLISVFPNPIQDRVQIQTKATDPKGMIELLNMYGQVLRKETITARSQLYWNLGHLTSGPYFLRYTNKDQFSIQRIWIE